MLAEHTPLTALKGVGPGVATKLAAIHLHTVQDLLFHLPLRYQDRTRISPIGTCRMGAELVLEGEVLTTELAFGRRRSMLCRIKDHSGIITLRFFHFSAAQKNALKPGTRIRCYGEVRAGKTGLELYHPEYQFVTDNHATPNSTHLTPVYPVTEGLQQTRLRALIDQALALLGNGETLVDWIPVQIREQLGFRSLTDSIRFLHHPPVQGATDSVLFRLAEGQHPAQKRLAFEELLSHRLCLRRLREQAERLSAPELRATKRLTGQFLDSLPFKLTKAQLKVCGEISSDLAQGRPMLRLLQGDVGSGKTIVAAMSALQAVENGFQAAVMAPTEILAEQHYLNFSRWLEPLGLQVGWLSGKVKGSKREEQLHDFGSGGAQVIVGTHALFQESVSFAKLGLIVIDEQHRFGVHQRLALREKGATAHFIPHQLVMTATPIPRTLAMSAYADLDCSIIDELPPGRTAVNTLIIANTRRDEVIERIHHACAQGSQAYWVCTLIEESEALQCQAAEATAETLRMQLPDIAIGLIHGRMKPREKTTIMDAFKAGLLQLLVATTVIEVGVDVPKASLMVIENPERLGLAQLHQLRGRVGRGAIASHCLLLYQAPLSQVARQRLAIMRDSNDGFLIAEKDLEIRGPGQVLGTQQTGLMSFRIADLSRDSGMLDQVKVQAELIQKQYPECVEPLIRRWLGDRELYGNV
ncbi:MAG: ATP-dependent DNA helicase RecG [Gammaproteobacteria bacterium]|nr:ATP-dependent DNA helicase RecG [Gammaproteobacteria bacterium]MDP2346548.1 ATP-dependent DNA helicase RecG [Gammaproteobacteria bacterium]